LARTASQSTSQHKCDIYRIIFIGAVIPAYSVQLHCMHDYDLHKMFKYLSKIYVMTFTVLIMYKWMYCTCTVRPKSHM